MNWDAIGAIAELLGAVGVIASLVYLATQIRHSRDQMSENTKNVRIASEHSRAHQRIEQSAFIARSPEINRIFWAGLQEPESLSEVDYRYFESIFSAYMAPFQSAFNLNREDALSPAEWAGQSAALEWAATQPGFKRYWQKWRSSHPPDFAALVDDVLSEILGEESERADRAR